MNQCDSNRILIVDPEPDRVVAMERALTKAAADVVAVTSDNAPDSIAWLARNRRRLALVSVHHDFGAEREHDGHWFDPGTGLDIAHYLAVRQGPCPFILHTDNFFIRPEFERVLDEVNCDYACVPIGNRLDWVETKWLPTVRQFLGSQSTSSLERC